MFNTKKVLVGALAMATLSGVFNPSFAETELACSVPVCDIAIEMESLKGQDHNARGMFGINLMEAHKNSTNITVLENLYHTGLALKDLTEEMGDEGWVLRSATDLINSVVLGLAKYSEIDTEKFISFYKQLEDQNARYAMVSHWHSELEKIESATKIEKLISFALEAEKISITLSDDDWVARAAGEFVSDATIKLIALDPAHEGLYEVSLSESAVAEGAFPFNRVAVLDSSSHDNLLVVFMNTKFKRIVYSFRNATISGNTVSGTFLSNADMANSFEFQMNRTTGAIQGSITTTQSVVEFAGKQTFSTREIFAGEVPYIVTKDEIVGKMQGYLGVTPGVLAIKSLKPNIYSATFKSRTSSIVLHFQGKYFPKTGVLSLTSNNEIKLTLALRETEDGIKWQGASFSTRSATSTMASFIPKK